MTDREKLMDLLCEALEDGCVGHCNYPYCHRVSSIADHLLANGVTFDKDINVPTKWIPVTERLPENNDVVLGRTWHKIYWIVQWNERYGEWEDCFTSEGCSHSEDSITHWMPLPEPPKEERRTDDK